MPKLKPRSIADLSKSMIWETSPMLQLSNARSESERGFGNSDRIKTVKLFYPKLVFLNLVSCCAVVKVRFRQTLKTIQSDPRFRIFREVSFRTFVDVPFFASLKLL